jgi:uncharacterized protein
VRIPLWCCRLIGATILVVPACRSGTPVKSSQERIDEKPRRAIVPLALLSDTLAICRLESTQPVPPWARPGQGELFSATRTTDELSIIVADSRAPRTAKCERDWRALKVQGPLDFNLVGIIAGLSGTLADAGVSIFALSTYDTDYVMVKQADFRRAVAALRQAGYPITPP